MDGRTDKPLYRDARTHLKIADRIGIARFWRHFYQFSAMKTQKIYDGRKENFKVRILSATTGSYLYSFGRYWWRKGKKDVGKVMKLCQAHSPVSLYTAQGHAPRYEGYHRCKGRGDQVLTCTCHMCKTNELSACFWVNTLMIAMGGNFFLIRVVEDL